MNKRQLKDPLTRTCQVSSESRALDENDKCRSSSEKYEQVSGLGRQMSLAEGARARTSQHSVVPCLGAGARGFLYGEVPCLGTGYGVGTSVYGEVQSTI